MNTHNGASITKDQNLKQTSTSRQLIDYNQHKSIMVYSKLFGSNLVHTVIVLLIVQPSVVQLLPTINAVANVLYLIAHYCLNDTSILY